MTELLGSPQQTKDNENIHNFEEDSFLGHTAV
jgi:hypothetical protein